MRKQEMMKLMPREVFRRMKSAQNIVVIGPTGSGKSTLIYALVNNKIVKFILVGVGKKNQTTIIPCNFMFDERLMRDEYFAICIKGKEYSFKQIHNKVMEVLAKLYVSSGYDVDETVESVTEEALAEVWEPKGADYHLGRISSDISVDDLRSIVERALQIIDEAEDSFKARVNKLKKEPDKRTVGIDEVRSIVMEEMWNDIPLELKEEYQRWLEEIGEIIKRRLEECLGKNGQIGVVGEYSVECDNEHNLPYGGDMLQHIFDPYEPYSLIVEDITLVCRPREELIEMFDDKIPLRFCLRDTMGLNQINMDSNSMKDALDIALNCSPDSILLLMSLEERNDVILNCCEAVSTKIGKAKKLDIPVNVIFTKADLAINTAITRADRDTVELMQADYDKHVLNAVASLEKDMKEYLTFFDEESATWLSIRYLEEAIDPIQMALRDAGSLLVNKFKKIGLYNEINELLYKTQMKILPQGIKSPLFVTVKNTELPAVNIVVNGEVLNEEFAQIQNTLTEDKATVNGYQIVDDRRIHGRSVVRYVENLRIGLGYTTNAYVYGNFSINMKGMIKKILEANMPKFMTLYESTAIKTLADNMEEVELDRLIQELDENEELTRFAFADVNPALIESLSSKDRKLQKLYLIFRHYFASSDKYYMVMDKVAFNMSYGNVEVRKMVNSFYYNPYLTYDETIRKMQAQFKAFFESDAFMVMLADEIGSAMTELVNKMFVII